MIVVNFIRPRISIICLICSIHFLIAPSCTQQTNLQNHLEEFNTNEYISGFLQMSSHEENPYGVPAGWSWARHSSNDEWTHLNALYGETRTNFWIEVYPYSNPVFPANVKIAVTNHVYLALMEGEDEWRVIQKKERLNGSWYNYEYNIERSQITDLEKEADGSYSFSVLPGGNAHLWPDYRPVPLSRYGELKAVIYIFHTRLILDDPSGPDNIAKAQYVIAGGLDWKLENGLCPSGLGYCDAIHHGKFIILGPEWRAYVATSMTEKELETFPPIPNRYFLLPNGQYPGI